MIALAILGVIATFTIPKVLQGQQDSSKKAVFKETIASLYDVLQTAQRDGTLRDTNFYAYFANKLNYVKSCNSDSTTQGCWNNTVQLNHFEAPQPGFVLHNGATLAGFNACCAATATKYVNSIVIDWNGIKPPNQLGQDTIRVTLCYGTSACDAAPSDYIIGAGYKGPGAIGPVHDEAQPNVDLWYEIFQ